MKYTTIGLIGRTNSGKSTLLNNLIGKKIAAVSQRVNTTRAPLTGIYSNDNSNFLILDAPGVCQIKTVLDRLMFQNILKIVEASDIIWWMISCEDEWKKDNQILAKILEETKKPIFLLLNKIDLMYKDNLLGKVNFFIQKFNFKEIIPLSAKKKKNLDKLISFSENYKVSTSASDDNKTFSLNNIFDIAEEIIREQILLQIQEEIPHQTVLIQENLTKKSNSIQLFFTLLVASQSQKAVILGKNGSKIKSIRLASEKFLLQLWKKRVFVFLQIKVHPLWFQDIRVLQKLKINWDYDKHSE